LLVLSQDLEFPVIQRVTAIEGTATLEKAMDVFDAVGACPRGLSQAELAKQLALPRTTLYRLLASLVARGLLRRDAQRRVYCLGFKCFEFARRVHDMPDLVAAASLELHALRDLTGETSYLGVLEGAQVVAMERCDGAHNLRSASVLGQAKPVYATSQGKAILSAMPVARREALVRELHLTALTPNTIIERRLLLEDLRVTAARRWSIDDEEIVPGIRCVGAPVVDVDGVVRGAISVAGPAFRMTLERLHGLGPEVAEAARRIGQQLRSQRIAAQPSETLAAEGNWAFRGAHPVWDRVSKTLYWTDALAPTVRVWDGLRDTELAQLDSPIMGLALHEGGLRVWCESGHWHLDPAIGASSLVKIGAWQDALPSALCSANATSFWSCQPVSAGKWRIALQSDDLPGEAKTHWTLTESVSALRWDPRRERLFAIDAAGTGILMMQSGQDKIRRFASIPAGSGRLSGLALTDDGGLWTALQNGWSVLRFGADGAQEQVLGLPVPKPQDLCLSDSEAGRLFVTSAREGVPFDVLHHAPLSGRLFCIPLQKRA
jgi:IclR family transcriptional regulator, acetate operon repressor